MSTTEKKQRRRRFDETGPDFIQMDDERQENTKRKIKLIEPSSRPGSGGEKKNMSGSIHFTGDGFPSK